MKLHSEIGGADFFFFPHEKGDLGYIIQVSWRHSGIPEFLVSSATHYIIPHPRQHIKGLSAIPSIPSLQTLRDSLLSPTSPYSLHHDLKTLAGGGMGN